MDDKFKKNLNNNSPTHHSDSLTRRVMEFLEKYSDSDPLSRIVIDTPSLKVINSPTGQVEESATLRLNESGSCFSITNISVN
jgi:hypothetical protein